MTNFITAFSAGCVLTCLAFAFCWFCGRPSENPTVVYFGFFIGVSFGSFAWAVFFMLKDIMK